MSDIRIDPGIIAAPAVEEMLTAQGLEWYTWIYRAQGVVFPRVPRADLDRLHTYLAGIGYDWTMHSKLENGVYRLQFAITRDTIADTRRGDAVAFDGRYEVVERREA